MTEVIKRSGNREPFSEGKLRESIRRASEKAKVNAERTNELIKIISRHGSKIAQQEDEISSQDIRNKILDELEAHKPDMAKAWREYEKNKPS
jgi:transcriptional repressor NrdR